MRMLMHGVRWTAVAIAFGLIVAVTVLAAPAAPVLAQEAQAAVPADGITLSIAELILGAIGTAFVPTVLALWSLFQAHAARSEAAWDDWVVARIKEVVRAMDRGESPTAAQVLDLTGKIGKGGGQ